MKNQFRKPEGWLGRWTLRKMNQHHAELTDWGLLHVEIPREGAILDIGCGGGKTIAKLCAASEAATVQGLDHSAESVRIASKTNAKEIAAGRVSIREGSVSQLPYDADSFDLVTAVETHFFWPNLSGDAREVARVVKPGGSFAIIAEVYRDPSGAKPVGRFAEDLGMTILTPNEHKELLAGAGFENIQVFTERLKNWICVLGQKPQQPPVRS
jgi:ubiquinone/menaquinone biosynthesis C-methylase UbiE